MPEPRNLGLSYLLAAIGLFGPAGLHRFYLGKPVTGIIWLLTGGLLFIGTIYDLLTMPEQVADSNRRRLGPGYVPAALPPGAGYGPGYGAGYAAGHAAPPPTQPTDPKVDLELRVLNLARANQGKLTTPVVATELKISLEDAQSKLDELAKNGHANIDISDEGVLIYDFPALRA